MESNKLAILERQLPLRAYPETKLDEVLKTSFKFWLANLLSIKADNEEKLDSALPSIKKHFWSLGIHEIKKAFEMYADGELITKPIPNYFDRILVGQIFKEYKQQKPIVKKEIKTPEPTQEEKDNLIYLGVINCFDEFVQTNKIINGYTWVYDHLEELEILKYSKTDKIKQMPIAKKRLISENKEVLSHSNYKQFTRDLENKRTDQAIINTAKKMLLERYFSNITCKNKHIKDFL